MRELELEIIDAFKQANKIIVTNNGKVVAFEKGSDELKKIIDILVNETFLDSYSMPALSVSLDMFIDDLKKQGMFMEIEFDKEFDFDGMNFDKLGFLVKEDFCGVDLNRSVKAKYFGRNFYLNLKGNMASLQKYLISLF